jgi:hypothetical protein
VSVSVSVRASSTDVLGGIVRMYGSSSVADSGGSGSRYVYKCIAIYIYIYIYVYVYVYVYIYTHMCVYIYIIYIIYKYGRLLYVCNQVVTSTAAKSTNTRC